MINNYKRIYAIGDIHLNIASEKRFAEKYPDIVEDKTRKLEVMKRTWDMSQWGTEWDNHIQITQEYWDTNVTEKDIVILAGDISWTKNMKKEGDDDLLWLTERPGIKVIVKGNHDYWFKRTPSKIKAMQEKYGMHFLTAENEYVDDDVVICGTKFTEFPYNNWPPINQVTLEPKPIDILYDEEKQKEEMINVKKALEKMVERSKKYEKMKIFVLHHPPYDQFGNDSEVSQLICQYKPDICLFGHIHTLPRLYTLPQYKTFDDICKTFTGCKIKKEETHFELVSSDVKCHQLTCIKEFILDNDGNKKKKKRRHRKEKKK